MASELGVGRCTLREAIKRLVARFIFTARKGTAIFLSSHASDYLNGAVIPVDGGYLVK